MPATATPVKAPAAAAALATAASARTPLPKGKPKNAPKTPKGTKFKWGPNASIKLNPFKVDNPIPLQLKLIDTTGGTHTFDYTKQNIDWASKTAVTKANYWYNQLISRKLNRPNPVCNLK